MSDDAMLDDAVPDDAASIDASADDAAGFDHLIHWVDDLDAAVEAYDSLGLPAQAALTMPGFRNAVWGVDDERYVEQATVDDWDAVATSAYAGSLGILRPAVDALGGVGALTFAVDVPDAHRTAQRLRDAGHDVEVVEVRLEDRDVGFVEVFATDLPSWFPFFITYRPPRAEMARLRAEHRASEGVSFDGRPDLTALLARSQMPEEDARRLGALLGCDVDGSNVRLPGADIRVETGRSAGLYGIAVSGATASDGPVELHGLLVVPEP